MRNLKRVLSLALALVMVLGMMVITTSAADFTDAEEIKYEEAVEVMSTLGILKGYPDGSFKPEGTLTRAEAAKIIAFVCMGAEADNYLTGSNADPFTDVKASSWAAKYVAFCKNAKIINGVNAEQTLFNPAGTLTTVQFAKMVLGAVGIEGSFTGAGWENNVKDAAKAAKLNVVAIDNSNITREEAAEMALAAMKYSATPDIYYVKKGEATIGTFKDLLEATLYANILGEGYSVAQAPATDSLLYTSYGVVYNGKTVDTFGRPAVSYTVGKNVLVFADEATISYEGYMDNKAGKLQVAADLEAAGVKLTATNKNKGEYNLGKDITVWTDGKAKPYASETNTKHITGYTAYKDNVTVEIFVSNKVVTDIVVIETHADIVKTFTEADVKAEKEAFITLNDAAVNAYETEAFEEGDVVLYTRAWNAEDEKYDVVAIEEAESFTGKLTSFNTSNKFTINGDVYTISYGSAEAFNSLKPEIQAQLGKDYVYHLGTNGEIIAANPLKGAKPVVITDYAYVMATDVDFETTKISATFGDGEATVVTGVVAKVYVVLSDGTFGIYSLEVAEEDDVYTVEIDGKDVELYGENVTTEVAADAALAANVDEIFTYVAAEEVISLVKNVTPAAATDAITKGSLAVDGALINNDTVVVLGKLNKKGEIDSWYTTGVAALDATELKGALVFTAPVKNDKDEKIADVATVIFAVDTAFKASEAVEELDVDAIVYIDGSYSTSKGLDQNGKPVTVYTYTGVKVDGTEVEVTGAQGLTAGVYMVNGKGQAVALDAKVATATQDVVTAIVGTTYQLKSGKVVTIKADVEPVALSSYVEMEVGADICYITNAKGAIVAVYVLDLY